MNNRSNEKFQMSLEQHSFRDYIGILRAKKKELTAVKQHIDRTIGQWSGIFSFLGKADKADLRPLVTKNISLVGEISDTFANMTRLYSGDRAHLLAYASRLEQRMEKNQELQSEPLLEIEKPKNALTLVKAILAYANNNDKMLIGKRQVLTEVTTRKYAEDLSRIVEECQQAHNSFVLISEQMRYAYEHLEGTALPMVSRIEQNEARKLIGASMGEVKAITDQVYLEVNKSYEQFSDLACHKRLPIYNMETKRIEFLKEDKLT